MYRVMSTCYIKLDRKLNRKTILKILKIKGQNQNGSILHYQCILVTSYDILSLKVLQQPMLVDTF